MKRYRHHIIKSSDGGGYPIAYIKAYQIGQDTNIVNSEVYSEGWNYQNGLYDYPPTIGITPMLDTFFTLNPLTPNIFATTLGSSNGGELARFTSTDGNYYDYVDELFKDKNGNTLGTQSLVVANMSSYFIDHYTGYGIYRITSGLITYNNYIGVGGRIETENTAVLLGYTDWRGLTAKEWNTLFRNVTKDDPVQSMVFDWTPFDSTSNSHTITTVPSNANQSVAANRNSGLNSAASTKSSITFQSYLIRDHFI